MGNTFKDIFIYCPIQLPTVLQKTQQFTMNLHCNLISFSPYRFNILKQELNTLPCQAAVHSHVSPRLAKFSGKTLNATSCRSITSICRDSASATCTSVWPPVEIQHVRPERHSGWGGRAALWVRGCDNECRSLDGLPAHLFSASVPLKSAESLIRLWQEV